MYQACSLPESQTGITLGIPHVLLFYGAFVDLMFAFAIMSHKGLGHGLVRVQYEKRDLCRQAETIIAYSTPLCFSKPQ